MHDSPFSTPYLLNFPEMHMEAVPAEPLPRKVFFDPGVHVQSSLHVWRPEDLPLNPDMARSFLRESARFAQEHVRSGQGLAASHLSKDDFYAQTALAIQAQLTTSADPHHSRTAQAIQAQQTLLLAWQLEQQALEIRAMHEKIQADMDGLNLILGLDEDEVNEASSLSGEQGWLNKAPLLLPWRMILDSLLFYAPLEMVLVTSNKEVIEFLEEFQHDHPWDGTAKMPESVVKSTTEGKAALVHAPGWRLTGRSRLPADKPWLEPMRIVLFGASDKNQTVQPKT